MVVGEGSWVVWVSVADAEKPFGGCLRYYSYYFALKRLVLSVFSGVLAVLVSLLGSFSSLSLGGLLLVHISFGSTIYARTGGEGYFCLPSLVQRM